MRFAFLGSGTGSNFGAILNAQKRGVFSGEIALVLSDVADAGILDIARDSQIDADYISAGKYKTILQGEEESAYIERLQESAIDCVVLAGFMRVIKDRMLCSFKDRIINIHPSLLPSFKGLHAWEQALNFGVKVTGCTVHFVNDQLDGGKIIDQSVVYVTDEDDYKSLHKKIQVEEHKLLPRLLQQIEEGKIPIGG